MNTRATCSISEGISIFNLHPFHIFLFTLTTSIVVSGQGNSFDWYCPVRCWYTLRIKQVKSEYQPYPRSTPGFPLTSNLTSWSELNNAAWWCKWKKLEAHIASQDCFRLANIAEGKFICNLSYALGFNPPAGSFDSRVKDCSFCGKSKYSFLQRKIRIVFF